MNLSLARPRDVLARLGTSWQRHDMSWQRCLDSGWWDGVEATVGAVCTVGGVRIRDAKNGASCAYGSARAAWAAWAAWAMPSCRRTASLPVPYAAPSGHFCAPPPLAE